MSTNKLKVAIVNNNNISEFIKIIVAIAMENITQKNS